MGEKIKYGILHCHSDNSIRDSAMTVHQLVEKARELGAPAVALTDHGGMTGYIDFLAECGEDIKPIVGVEAYVEENDEGRKHLILMAADHQGFKALSRAVSESNRRVEKIGMLAFPRMNKQILTDCFGPGSPGHGHVIATSACVSGVLASNVFVNKGIDEKVKKLRKRQENYVSPDSEAYKKDRARLKELRAIQAGLGADIRDLKKQSSKSTNTLEKRVAKNKEIPGKYPGAEDELEEALKAKKEAADQLLKTQEKKTAVDADVTYLNKVVKDTAAQIKKWSAVQESIDKILQNAFNEEDVDSVIMDEARWYENTFGKGFFYIELQYHGLPDEKRAMKKLAEISDILDIPACIANDAHIPENTPDAVLARAVIRATAFEHWEDPTSADRELYIKTDEELISKLSEIIPREKVLEGFENVGKIVSMCNLVIPDEKHYPKFKTPDGSSSADYLRKMVYDRIYTRYSPEEFDEEHRQRMKHELDTMISMGYADYHCIVEDMLRYARAAGKLNLNDPEEEKIALSFDIEKIEQYVKGRAGECVGPGRGSAAGSIVCYIIGITNIDPIKYGLLFERFLNPERVSMPDIDCDIETNVRPYVIQYVRHKYGLNSVCGIMNRVKNTGKAAIRTAGRVYGMKKKNDSTAYLSIIGEIGAKAIELSPDELHINISDICWELLEGFTDNPDAKEIIRYAALIDGTCASISQHAAGIIITDGQPVSEYVPLIYSTKNDIMLTQCDMVQAEIIGLLKVDFLGLNNLTIITETAKEIQKNSGVMIDMDNIPFEQEVFEQIFSKAMTNSVFQFESQGMKNMLRNFRPESVFDLTLLVAMYRPGPLQFLDDVIAVKTGKKEVSYLTPELRPILSSTYGSITYQEQVQEIFRELAGYSLGQADLVRRAMSKKKDKVLVAERESFLHGDPERNIPGCIANGIDEGAANELFDEMTNFAKYAFNKSHAACYAVVAYQTAWLKYHYPAEYMKSVLNNVDFDKYVGLFADLRQMKIPVLVPDVNRSDMDFTIENGKIRFGLSKIKGLGKSVAGIAIERKKHGQYRSIGDFAVRTEPDKKVIQALVGSGGFDGFCDNRAAVSGIMEDLKPDIKKLKDLKKKADAAIDPQKRANYLKKIEDAAARILEAKPDTDLCESPLEKLVEERRLLGDYISGHPLDYYPKPYNVKAQEIGGIPGENPGKHVSVMGIISDFRVKNRKSDGAAFGIFRITDRTGQVEACCFTKQYPMCKDALHDDAVVKIEGRIMNDQQDPEKRKVSVENVKILSPLKNTVIIFVKDIDDWQENVLNRVKTYVAQNGNPVRVYDLMLDEFRKCDLFVTPSIVNDSSIRSRVGNFMI